ncbi:hypothetical protein PF005_g27319 [Phytophthora fragariae]|uniref:TRAF-type domain-containing protein n=1 Tax=Phytophthora fragariae TaxID=53985 RepID=A0A6A3VTL5_9STRA|nr:hypothetical protein PF009_g23606 [Phytophthora fragariae]KAE8970829.1 hypothetical protein PF011_g26270 [Phytophthora fragariae]KAE9171031.1 hypothetical protein PF005_g27319 [Phytophthora fragariae]
MAYAVKRGLPAQLQPNGVPLVPSHKLQCFSVACLDMPHLEFGDKVVLPPKILLELKCSNISTPFLFKVRAGGVDSTEGNGIYRPQYCSVQEFSAPEGQVFLPYWLMQNLHVPEGGSVVVSSVTDLPRGIYCRLQPETTSFLDLAAKIGPKLLMETAFRRYSVLSMNSIIVIEYGNVRYYVRIAELKPASVVSLCGDVDLETDFMPPEGSDPKRPSTAKSFSSDERASMQPPPSDSASVADCNVTPPNNSLASGTCYGRRLRDGGYVESSLANTTQKSENAPRKIPLSSLQKAQQNIRDIKTKLISMEALAAVADSSVLAAQLRLAQGSFSTPGFALGTAMPSQNMESIAAQLNVGKSKSDAKNTRTNALDAELAPQPDPKDQQDVHRCKLCLADVSAINMEIHTLRCTKNPAYHKFECSICQEKILLVHEEQHQHCPECTLLELQDHVDNGRCDHALVPCSLCGLAFKKKDMARHFTMCSSRTEYCDVCKAYIKITEFEAHQQQCEAVILRDQSVLGTSGSLYKNTRSPHRAEISNQPSIECVYCFQGGFSSIADVEHHVMSDCRIAKSFAAPEPLPNSNQEEADPPPDGSEESQDDAAVRPLLAQGRLRRKGDISALHRHPSPAQQKSTPESSNSNNNQLNHLPVTDPLVRRSATKFLGPSTRLPPSRPTQQTGKLHKPKLKPRPNPHLSSLPQRVSKALEGPRSSSISAMNVNSGPAELCISSAGGTSHRTLLPQSRAQALNRVRRRPAASGRLDKLP